MLNREARERIVSAVGDLGSASSDADQVWIRPYSRCADAGRNQFALFVKPGATAVADGVHFDAILGALLDTLSLHKIEIGAVRVVSGRFFQRTGIMVRHYSVINAISCLGGAALTEAARAKLQEHFGEQLSAGYEVLGGHQFLQRYPEFTPFALSILFDSLGCVRLGPGTYARELKVEGRGILLLNGFHPYQLERFTRPHAVTVLMEGQTLTPWKQLRGEFAGATNPAKAAPGSFRRTLLERADEFGLREVSQNKNGIHVSAGPLEGMAEVRRFFCQSGTDELPIGDTCFGQVLTGAGMSQEAIMSLVGNPVLRAQGKMISAFDLSEELDSRDAAEALQAAL